MMSHFGGGSTFSTLIPFYVAIDSIGDVEVNLIGIKMGDVNGDVNLNTQASGEMVINIENVRAVKGEEISVGLESEIKEIEGYQFSICFDPNDMELINIEGARA